MFKNQELVKEKYKKYTQKNSNQSYKTLCSLSTFKLNNVQKFLGEYVKKQNKILLYHGIGSGKTITIIHMCENAGLKGINQIVTQASLIGSFYNEIIKYDIAMRNFKYVSKENYKRMKEIEKNKQDSILSKDEKTEYKEIKDSILKNIKKKYEIRSYEKFRKRRFFDLNDQQLLVIDEIQNILNSDSSNYLGVVSAIMKSHKFKKDKMCGIIISSATPIYDSYKDFFTTLNLLTPYDKFDYKKLISNKYSEADKIEYLKKIIKFINEHVSYYEPANNDNILYPKKSFVLEKCEMSDFQYKRYLETGLANIYESDAATLSKEFLSGPRLVSNFAFENPDDSKEENIRTIYLNYLHNYSTKYDKLMKNILKNKHGKIVIYSNFINNYGISVIKQILEHNKFKDYKDIIKNQETFYKGHKDYKTFACFTGKETDKYRNEIIDYFNNPLNYDGKNLKILLLSPAGKEGLTLLGVREIHIMEPYWNNSRIEQIEGRGFRSCSHKYLPSKERNIKTFLYLATIKKHVNKSKQSKIVTELNEKDKFKKKKHFDPWSEDGKMVKYIKYFMSVDEYIYEMALEKDRVNKEFRDLLKLNSLDCELFKNVNGIKHCKKKDITFEKVNNDVKKFYKNK